MMPCPAAAMCWQPEVLCTSRHACSHMLPCMSLRHYDFQLHSGDMEAAQQVNSAYLAIESSAACAGGEDGPASGDRRLLGLVMETEQNSRGGTGATLHPPGRICQHRCMSLRSVSMSLPEV